MEQITLRLNYTLYNPILILETFNSIELPKEGYACNCWQNHSKNETPNEPTPGLVHSQIVSFLKMFTFNYLRIECI